MAELLSTQDVADTLRVDRSTVHRWVLKGLLEPAQVVQLRGKKKTAVVYRFDADYIAELATIKEQARSA